MSLLTDESKILLYENGPYSVRPNKTGYEVCKDGFTHATVVFQTYFTGERGLKRATQVADNFAKRDTK